MILKIDTDQLNNLVKDGDSILFTPEGEQVLVTFKKIQALVEEADKEIRHKIESTGKTLDKNFKTISGDFVSATLVERGDKYFIDESLLKEMDNTFYTKEVKYKPVTKEIDKFRKQKGALPYGVKEPERTASLTITVKKEKK